MPHPSVLLRPCASILLFVLAAGCATSVRVGDTEGEKDDLMTQTELGAAPDGAAEADLLQSTDRDLSSSPDLAMAPDLAKPPDLAMAPDLAVPPDLAMAPDLRVPDLAMPPDLTMPPDLAVPPDLAPITGCEVVPQSGCPMAQKCTTHDAIVSICDPNGSVPRPRSCTFTGDRDDCAAGNICIDEGASKRQCRAFCKTDAHCANARSFCDFDLGTAMKFKVCSQPCNAIYPGAGCEPGLGCYAYDKEHTDCTAPGSMDVGMPCGGAFDCKPGMVCVGPAGASLCRRVCRKGDAAVCGGLFCFDLRSGAFNWPTYGVCCPLAGC